LGTHDISVLTGIQNLHEPSLVSRISHSSYDTKTQESHHALRSPEQRQHPPLRVTASFRRQLPPTKSAMNYCHIYSAHRNPRVLITSFNYLVPFGLRDNATLLRTKHALRQFLLKTARAWALYLSFHNILTKTVVESN